ncbi:MAG: YceH family protein [Acidimicrobiia bacterium]
MSLSPEEARVLGCLLEKERTTPDAYPLSLNALVSACNQSTNRSPVVHYSETTVETALDELRERSFVRRGVYPGSRVIKYRHVLDEALGIGPPEMAVLGVLLLRGPQTPGELKARTERLHSFRDLVAVEDTLDRLSGRDEPLTRRLTREPGQKEARVCELLTEAGGEVTAIVPDDAPVEWKPDPAAGESSETPLVAGGLAERVSALESELALLRRELEALRDSLGG